MGLWDAEPVPSRVIGLMHTAVALEIETGGPVSREELEKWCSPKSLTGSEAHTQFGQVLGECRTLNLLVEEEAKGTYRVSPALLEPFSGNRRSDLAGIQAATTLAGRIRMEVLKHLAGATPADANVNFCRMLAWLLMQRGADYPLSKDAAERLAQRQDPERAVVGFNDVRFGSARFWTVFLGFGWQQAVDGASGAVEALQPDPTDALSLLLSGWTAERVGTDANPLISFTDFLRRIGDVYPWMEGGDIARDVRERLPDPPIQPDGQACDTTALALLRLERKGLVRLHRPSDAPVSSVRTLGWGGPPKEASHIEWLGHGSTK